MKKQAYGNRGDPFLKTFFPDDLRKCGYPGPERFFQFFRGIGVCNLLPV